MGSAAERAGGSAAALSPVPEVGRDYFGGTVTPLAEYRVLEDKITASHPRFDAGRPLDERVFPG
jgi:hypothetical protein